MWSAEGMRSWGPKIERVDREDAARLCGFSKAGEWSRDGPLCFGMDKQRGYRAQRGGGKRPFFFSYVETDKNSLNTSRCSGLSNLKTPDFTNATTYMRFNFLRFSVLGVGLLLL